MGILSWIAIGIVVPVVVRFVATALGWTRRTPGIGPGLAGSVLGGFLIDLTMRGDSVMNLNATTLIGAIVGAMILVGLGYRFAGPAEAHRDPV